MQTIPVYFAGPEYVKLVSSLYSNAQKTNKKTKKHKTQKTGNTTTGKHKTQEKDDPSQSSSEEVSSFLNKCPISFSPELSSTESANSSFDENWEKISDSDFRENDSAKRELRKMSVDFKKVNKVHKNMSLIQGGLITNIFNFVSG